MKTKKKTKLKLIEIVKGFEMALSLGFTLSLPLVVGIFFGTMLDAKTHLQPLFTLIFLLLGLIVSFVGILKILKDNIKTNG